jgi:hypothetical protein
VASMTAETAGKTSLFQISAELEWAKSEDGPSKPTYQFGTCIDDVQPHVVR